MVWGKKIDGQAYKKKPKTHSGHTDESSTKEKQSKKTMKYKTEYKKNEYVEAYEQLMQLKIIQQWGGTLKLEYDQNSEKIYITQYANSSSYMRNNSTGNNLIHLASVDDNYDVLEQFGIIGEYFNKSFITPQKTDTIIAETEGTILDNLGRKATTDEIKNYNLHEYNSPRVMNLIDAYNKVDWRDLYEYEINRIANIIDKNTTKNI